MVVYQVCGLDAPHLFVWLFTVLYTEGGLMGLLAVVTFSACLSGLLAFVTLS